MGGTDFVDRSRSVGDMTVGRGGGVLLLLLLLRRLGFEFVPVILVGSAIEGGRPVDCDSESGLLVVVLDTHCCGEGTRVACCVGGELAGEPVRLVDGRDGPPAPPVRPSESAPADCDRCELGCAEFDDSAREDFELPEFVSGDAVRGNGGARVDGCDVGEGLTGLEEVSAEVAQLELIGTVVGEGVLGGTGRGDALESVSAFGLRCCGLCDDCCNADGST